MSTQPLDDNAFAQRLRDKRGGPPVPTKPERQPRATKLELVRAAHRIVSEQLVRSEETAAKLGAIVEDLREQLREADEHIIVLERGKIEAGARRHTLDSAVAFWLGVLAGAATMSVCVLLEYVHP